MEPERWKSIGHFPHWKISTYGNILDPDGNLVEPYFDNDRLFNGGDVPFVQLEQWEWFYKGPIWWQMMNTFFDGNRDGMKFEYVDGDSSNLYIENLIPVWMHPEHGWIAARWRIDPFGDRYIDRRLGKRIQIVETGEIFNSVAEVARAIDGDRSNIYSVLRGRLMSTKGYTFLQIE